MTKKINIADDKHHELKVHCANANVQMNIFVQDAVREKMEREPLGR